MLSAEQKVSLHECDSQTAEREVCGEVCGGKQIGRLLARTGERGGSPPPSGLPHQLRVILRVAGHWPLEYNSCWSVWRAEARGWALKRGGACQELGGREGGSLGEYRAGPGGDL